MMNKRDLHIRPLLNMLFRLGVKSARVGIIADFRGAMIYKPGAYSRTAI